MGSEADVELVIRSTDEYSSGVAQAEGTVQRFSEHSTGSIRSLGIVTSATARILHITGQDGAAQFVLMANQALVATHAVERLTGATTRLAAARREAAVAGAAGGAAGEAGGLAAGGAGLLAGANPVAVAAVALVIGAAIGSAITKAIDSKNAKPNAGPLTVNIDARGNLGDQRQLTDMVAQEVSRTIGPRSHYSQTR